MQISSVSDIIKSNMPIYLGSMDVILLQDIFRKNGDALAGHALERIRRCYNRDSCLDLIAADGYWHQFVLVL